MPAAAARPRRVDFVLESDDEIVLVEVKCCVCADYPAGMVPEARTKVGACCRLPTALTPPTPH
jgi:DNA-binding sugar fermentation-stimulating protein